MSITSGNLILASEFNSVQSRISQILGIGFNDFGYGQAVASTQVSPPSKAGAVDADDISAEQMNNLLLDLRKIYQHQRGEVLEIENFSTADVIGATVTSTSVNLYYNIDSVKVISGGSGFEDDVEISFSAPDLETGRTAEANLIVQDGTILEIIIVDKGSGYLTEPSISFSNTPSVEPELKTYLGTNTSTSIESPDTAKSLPSFINLLEELENNRFDIDSSQSEIQTIKIDRRTTPWNNILAATFEVVFSSADQRRYFFNSGGEILIEGILSDLDRESSSYLNNEIWSKLIGNSGIISFGYNYTKNTGNPGNTPNGIIGNYNLTTDYQVIFSRGGAEQYLYADSRWTISAREKNPSTIEFLIEIKDKGPESGELYNLYSIYTPTDEPVTATIEFEYSARKASGSVISAFPVIEITNSLE
jgi:hypothetical protein